MLDPELERWLVACPPVVRHLARQYPPGHALDLDGERRYVVSYEENERLGLSRIDPRTDHKAAQLQRTLINAHHIPGYRPFSTSEPL
jgi:hypothetical protein